MPKVKGQVSEWLVKTSLYSSEYAQNSFSVLFFLYEDIKEVKAWKIESSQCLTN